MAASSSPARVTPQQIARLRLQTLGIHPSESIGSLTTPLQVVGHHLAMQSQDWGASRWAIGSRLPAGAVEADVLRAYDEGVIVRSWPMRGTVHAVVAEDLHWMLNLMGTRALSGVARRWEMLGIDEPWLERARDVATSLLQGGLRASRAELTQALTDAGLDLAGQRAYHTVWYLATTGTLVLGPTRDGDQLLALLDEWIPQPRLLDRDQALAELARRFLSSRGPATLDDLVYWSKLTKTDGRAAINACRDELVELSCSEQTLYMLREQHEMMDPSHRSISNAVYALAGFDEHLLGYRVRDAVLDPRHANLVDPGRNGVFRWTIVAGGQVVATWSRTKRSKYVSATIKPFKPLSTTVDRASRRSIDSYGSFIGRELRVAE